MAEETEEFSRIALLNKVRKPINRPTIHLETSADTKKAVEIVKNNIDLI